MVIALGMAQPEDCTSWLNSVTDCPGCAGASVNQSTFIELGSPFVYSVSDAFNRTFRRGSNAAQTQSGGLLSSGNLPSSMPRRAHGAGSMMISSEI